MTKTETINWFKALKEAVNNKDHSKISKLLNEPAVAQPLERYNLIRAIKSYSKSLMFEVMKLDDAGKYRQCCRKILDDFDKEYSEGLHRCHDNRACCLEGHPEYIDIITHVFEE